MQQKLRKREDTSTAVRVTPLRPPHFLNSVVPHTDLRARINGWPYTLGRTSDDRNPIEKSHLEWPKNMTVNLSFD